MAIIRKIQRVHCRMVFLVSGLGYIKRDSGQEIAEAAFVLPILFLIMLAIFWFGRAFNISSTLDRAAREGVKAASRRSCAMCGNAFETDSQVVAQITAVLNADRLQIGSVQT